MAHGQRGQSNGGNNATNLVAYAHNGNPLRAPVVRAKKADIGVYGHLQYGKASPKHHKAPQRAGVGPGMQALAG